MCDTPKTLVEAVKYFSNIDLCNEYMKQVKWPDGKITCPKCGGDSIGEMKTRRMLKCRAGDCRKQFSYKVGTIFEDSPLGLDKWFVAVWCITNCKNGISSYELARDLGITQKSAWHMLHRIRTAMEVGGIEKMDGEVEADETFMGGVAINMHDHKRKAVEARHGTLSAAKSVVAGLLRRTAGDDASRVRVRHIKDTSKKSLQHLVRETVEPGSRLLTDSWKAYRGLSGEYLHEVVNHRAQEYVRGTVHTNGIENFWSLLKRTVKGTYVSVEPFHLGRYLSEQAFRFNERKDDDFGRFTKALGGIVGKRLTYKELTGHALSEAAA